MPINTDRVRLTADKPLEVGGAATCLCGAQKVILAKVFEHPICQACDTVFKNYAGCDFSNEAKPPRLV